MYLFIVASIKTQFSAIEVWKIYLKLTVLDILHGLDSCSTLVALDTKVSGKI